jgi:fimbrial chaperone protein
MGRFVQYLALVCASFCLLHADKAQAGGFDVAPISLTLSAKAANGMLVVTNRSKEPLRFHVSASAWDQTPEGEMVLTPTRDIMFFPAMLTLNPQESRNLRVGVVAKPGTTEKTYRVFVQELPALATAEQQGGGTVGMLVKLGIPVFLEPTAAPKAAPSVSALQLQGPKFSFNLNNTGNSHFVPDRILVKARDGSTVLHTEEVNAWYVLPGRKTRYAVTLPAAVCVGIKSVDVELKWARGPTTATLENVHCTP